MANNDTPRGFKPVKYLDGGPYTGQARKYFVPSTDTTAIYLGGPVKIAGSADSRGVPTVTAATTGDRVVGVMIGRGDATRDDVLYREASKAQYILCSPVENLLYEVQDDAGSTLAATDVGANASFTAESGGTTYGYSTIEIDATSVDTTATLALQIVELADRDDNTIGDNAKWLVRFNDNQFVNQATGV